MAKNVQIKVAGKLGISLDKSSVNSSIKQLQASIGKIKPILLVDPKQQKALQDAVKSTKAIQQNMSKLGQNLPALAKHWNNVNTNALKYEQTLRRINALEGASGRNSVGGAGVGAGTRRATPGTRRARGFGKTSGRGRVGFAVGAADMLLGGMGFDMPTPLGAALGIAGGAASGASLGAFGGPVGAGIGAIGGGTAELIRTLMEIRQSRMEQASNIPENVKKYEADQDFLKTFGKKFDQEFKSIDPRSNRTGGRSKDLVIEQQQRLRQMARNFGGDSSEAKEINRILTSAGFKRENVPGIKEIAQQRRYNAIDELQPELLAGVDVRAKSFASLRSEREKLNQLQGGKGPTYDRKYLDSLKSGLDVNIKARDTLRGELSAPNAASKNPEAYKEALTNLAKFEELVSHGNDELAKFTDVVARSAQVQGELNTIKDKELQLNQTFKSFIGMDDKGRRNFQDTLTGAQSFAKDKAQQGLFNTFDNARQNQIIQGLSFYGKSKIGAGGETGDELIAKLQAGFGPLFQLSEDDKKRKAELTKQQAEINALAVEAQSKVIDLHAQQMNQFLGNLNKEFNRLIAELARINAIRPVGKANGGFASRGTDTVPAMLTPGEFVINKRATTKFLPLLQQINSGGLNPDNVTYAAVGARVRDKDKRQDLWFQRREARRARKLAVRGFSQDDINAIEGTRNREGVFEARALRRSMSRNMMGRLNREDRSLNRMGLLGAKNDFTNAMKNFAGNGPRPQLDNFLASARGNMRFNRAYNKRLARRSRMGFASGGVVPQFLASGGSVNDGGGFDASQFMNAARSMDSSASRMNTAASVVMNASMMIADSLKGIPSEISLIGSYHINITHNGLSVVTELEPMVRKMIDDGISKMNRNYRGMSDEGESNMFRRLDGE
jgi:hypothetical protein